MGWRDQAACIGKTDLFFGPAGERPERRVERERKAKAICALCPVVAQCRKASRDEYGVWGGLNEAERGIPSRPTRAVFDGGDLRRRQPTDPVRARAAAMLAAGEPAEAVAVRFGISTRTAFRWKEEARGQSTQGDLLRHVMG